MMKKVYAILLMILLTGCSSNQTSVPAIPSILPTASPISAETLLPPASTSTPSPVFTSPPLWTPLPTFSSTAAEETLRIWIQGTFECLLPCWGGITPGETNWHEARQIVEQLSGFATVNVSENINCGFGACNGVAWSLYPSTVAEGAFYTSLPDNQVHLIRINIQNEGKAGKINLLRNIGLQEVFRWYGLPPIFLLKVETDQAENKFMNLILVYPERQSIIRYVKNAEVVDGNVVNCGPDHQIEFLILDNKEQLMSFDAIVNGVETGGFQIDHRYKPLEEATGITPNSFFNAISTFRDYCISTPVSMWNP